MQPYIFYALATALAISISLLVNKVVIKTVKLTSLQYGLMFHLSAGIGALFLLYKPLSLSQMYLVLPYAVFGGIMWTLGDVLLFYVLRRIDASILGSLFMFKVFIIPVIAFFLFKEVFHLQTYLFLIPLIFGGFLVSSSEHFHLSSFFRKEVGIALVSLLLFSLSDTAGKFGITHVGAFSYLGILCLSAAVFSGVGLLFISETKTFTLPLLKKFLVLGSIVVCINLFFLLGAMENLTLTNAIAMLNAPFLLLITFVLSRFRPNLLEKHSPRVYAIRAIGSLIMYASAVAIVLQ